MFSGCFIESETEERFVCFKCSYKGNIWAFIDEDKKNAIKSRLNIIKMESDKNKLENEKKKLEDEIRELKSKKEEEKNKKDNSKKVDEKKNNIKLTFENKDKNISFPIECNEGDKFKELEEGDLKFLKDSPLIYISYDNKDFSNLNYYYEYKFIKPIKSGGFAQVYLGENVLNKKLVAIKKTDIKNFSTEEIFNLTREGKLISNLNHPNIIKIYCYYAYDNYLYNVMEYAKGGELTQYINNTKEIPENKIKSIFKQIYDAVKYIHNKNIIHRDLKTNNIVFLDEEKTKVAIIDFGISSTFSGGDVLNAGTLRYLPPEAFEENNRNSISFDMWALGVILYILNFKTFPFDGKSSSHIKKSIIYEPVNYPKNLKIRKTLLESYKKFGIKLLDYEPAIFDSGTEKFVWVRHNYSGQYQFSEKIKKYLKEYNFDLYNIRKRL